LKSSYNFFFINLYLTDYIICFFECFWEMNKYSRILAETCIFFLPFYCESFAENWKFLLSCINEGLKNETNRNEIFKQRNETKFLKRWKFPTSFYKPVVYNFFVFRRCQKKIKRLCILFGNTTIALFLMTWKVLRVSKLISMAYRKKLPSNILHSRIRVFNSTASSVRVKEKYSWKHLKQLFCSVFFFKNLYWEKCC
jgi:hypothetical protein